MGPGSSSSPPGLYANSASRSQAGSATQPSAGERKREREPGVSEAAPLLLHNPEQHPFFLVGSQQRGCGAAPLCVLALPRRHTPKIRGWQPETRAAGATQPVLPRFLGSKPSPLPLLPRSHGVWDPRGLTAAAADAGGGAVGPVSPAGFPPGLAGRGQEILLAAPQRLRGAQVAAQLLAAADVGPEAAPLVPGAAGQALHGVEMWWQRGCPLPPSCYFFFPASPHP